MPTQAMLGGDFSAFLNPAATLNAKSGQPAGVDALGRPVVFGQIYDPNTTRLVKAGAVDPVTGQQAVDTGLVREPFANNAIPAPRFDPVAAAYLKLQFPTNFSNAQIINNIPSYKLQPTFDQNLLAIKLDQVVTSKQKASFFFTTISRKRSNSGYGTWAIPGVSPLDTWHYQNNPGKIIRANHYWTLSPHLLNHLGVGYQRFTNIYTTPFSDKNWGSTLGLQNIVPMAFPTVTFTGGQPSLGDSTNRFGDGSNGGGSIDQNVIGLDQVFISRGAHQIQVGTEWRFYRENDLNITTPPTFQFANAQTDDGQTTAKFAGNAVASFLLGQVNSTSSSLYVGNFEFNRREVGTYVQDDWKVTPNLSLNLGLRWEVMGGITEPHGYMTTFNPGLANPGAGNLPGALQFASQLKKKGFEDTQWSIFLPRVGITYAVSPKMVWRAGFGINTQSPEGGPSFQFTGVPSSLGYSGTIQINHTTNPQPYPDIAVASLSSPYPSYSGVLPNYDSTQANGQTAPAYIRPDGARVMYVENYNTGFQYDLGHQTIAEVNYVGNTGKRLYAFGTDQLNQLPIGDLAAYGDALLDPLSQHPEIPVPYPGFSTDNQVNQALAPFPQYAGGGISQYDSHLGWSRYDSLQATITRRVSKGFNLMAAYTWSKTMTNTNSNCNSGQCAAVQDVHNLRLEKAVAQGIHVPHQFKLTGFYDLPFGAGRAFALHGPAQWLAGGWTLSGNAIYESGDTLQITDSYVSNGIFGATRPNYTGEAIQLNGSGRIDIANSDGPQYLNPAAFTHVATSPRNVVALTTGNVPSALGTVLGPGRASENASLQKSFGLGEGRSFQLRADAINLFNRAGRGNPVTDINDPNFGKIIVSGADSNGDQYSSRIVQLSGRVTF